MGTGAYDFDNDGWEDLFVAHGGLIHMVPMEHTVLRNLGDWKFEDVSSTAGPYIEKTKTVARGAAFGDFDDDGKMDVFIVDLQVRPQSCSTTSPSRRITGRRSSWSGRRATATASARRSKISRTAGIGSANASDPPGTSPATTRECDSGSAPTKIDKVVVTWPTGGAKQVLENVPVDRVVTITEK